MELSDILNIATLAVVVLTVFVVLFGKRKGKIKAGLSGFEVETGFDVDPSDACPYDKAYTAARQATREVDWHVRTLERDLKREQEALKYEVICTSGAITKIEINLMKLIFNSPDSPLENRMTVGLELVALYSENGDTKKDVMGFALKHYEVYRAVCAGRPELRIYDVEDIKREDV